MSKALIACRCGAILHQRGFSWQLDPMMKLEIEFWCERCGRMYEDPAARIVRLFSAERPDFRAATNQAEIEKLDAMYAWLLGVGFQYSDATNTWCLHVESQRQISLSGEFVNEGALYYGMDLFKRTVHEALAKDYADARIGEIPW